MLAIRLQRRGRKGHAQYRVIVQDSRHSPHGGRVVASLGSYNPHNRKAQLNTEEVDRFLKNGAQPSNSVAKILKNEGVKLPKWVTIIESYQGKTKNPDKFADGNESSEQAAEKADDTEAENDQEPTDDKPAEVSDQPEEANAEGADKPAEEAAKEEPKEESKEESKDTTEADKPADSAEAKE